MSTEFSPDDYVRIFDVTGKPQVGKIFFMSKNGSHASIVLLNGYGATRKLSNMEKLSDGEIMLLKLENA